MFTPPAAQHASSGFPLIDADVRYADRIAAGRQLTQLLLRYRGSRTLVLALPPGGVIVAGEVARALRLPLDVLVAREIVIRPYPAIVAGALSEGGGLCLNRAVFRLPGASLGAFWREALHTAHEIAALAECYRPGRALPSLQRRTVILVDDGLGDGLVQLAAIAAARRLHAAHCVVATPLATPAAIQQVARRADQVIALASEELDQPDGAGHWRQLIDDAEAAALVENERRHSEDAG